MLQIYIQPARSISRRKRRYFQHGARRMDQLNGGKNMAAFMFYVPATLIILTIAGFISDNFL
jgi:hypothetical protein